MVEARGQQRQQLKASVPKADDASNIITVPDNIDVSAVQNTAPAIGWGKSGIGRKRGQGAGTGTKTHVDRCTTDDTLEKGSDAVVGASPQKAEVPTRSKMKVAPKTVLRAVRRLLSVAQFERFSYCNG